MSHPILGDRRRLLLYLAVWLPGGLLIGVLVAMVGDLGWLDAQLLALPMAQIYAFICLAAWYPARANPLSSARAWRVVISHLLAGVLSSAVWQLAGAGLAFAVSRLRLSSGLDQRFLPQVPLFFVLGLLLYLLAVAVSYLAIAGERSRQAETRALEAQQAQAVQARELELARSLQSRLLPAPEQTGDGFRLAARNLAARYVAGDFYDFFRLPSGELAIAVADVSGKGIAASLITATVKAMLPLIAAERSLVATLDALNRRLVSDLTEREFVALALARFDPESGRLELVNAGLPDPYLLRPGTAAWPLEVPQPRLPLGLRTEVGYRSVEVTLAPGERMLFLTDGLPEAPVRDGEPLGYEALATLLEAEPALPAAWLDALLERVRAATVSELEDDWTAVLLERTA